ncbi:MAG: DUF167 domain-containing protein [Proteobacteria bacterium]|nr:DUF167 domain-containing protein [Pseudomonadota bacterium]
MQLIVHLTPKASRNKIEGWSLDAEKKRILRVRVTAVPEDGKANKALIQLLSKTLHISKSRISLIRGETSRIKQLEIKMDEREEDILMNLFEYPS